MMVMTMEVWREGALSGGLANGNAGTGQAQQRSGGTLGEIVEDLRLLGPEVDGGEGHSSRGNGRDGGFGKGEHCDCVLVLYW